MVILPIMNIAFTIGTSTKFSSIIILNMLTLSFLGAYLKASEYAHRRIRWPELQDFHRRWQNFLRNADREDAEWMDCYWQVFGDNPFLRLHPEALADYNELYQLYHKGKRPAYLAKLKEVRNDYSRLF